MKKLMYLFVFVVFACSTDNPAKQKAAGVEKNSPMELVVERHNEENSHSHAEYSEHEIKLGMSGDYLVLVNKEDGEDRTYHLIQLRPEDAAEFESLESGSYKVSDLGAELILKHAEKTYYFSTLEEPEHEQLFENTTSYSVIGISKNYIEEEIQNSVDGGESEFDPYVKKGRCKCISIYAYERCDAGGEGSNSCSIADCSVSCNQGYYACCNNA